MTRPLLVMCLGTFLLAALAADAGVQSSRASTYIEILERYQNGDDDAVAQLAALDRKALESGARAVLQAFEEAPMPASRLLRAAIVAHTEAATPRPLGTAISWFPHLDLAERYAGRLAAKDGDDPVALAWWFIAIGAMHQQRNYAQAAIIVQRGRQACGDRPEFVFALGVTHELAWVWEHGRDLRSPFGGSLADAEKAYARIVASQPEFFAARIRLGRVRTLRGDNEGAVRTLAAIPDSASPVLVYLARLFEGDALERQGRVEEARKRYDAAVRSGPYPQSAQLALAYLQYQDGARVDAANRVRETVADGGAGEQDDPWFWYSMGLGGIVRPELSALRALVRQ